MILHTMQFYDWLVKALEDMERLVRNFLWSGHVEKRKLIIVAWHKCCRYVKEGGLGLRSLININKATKLKHCWDFLSEDNNWSTHLKARGLRNGRHIKNNILSLISTDLKSQFTTIYDNSSWLICNSKYANFWLDNLCDTPLASRYIIPIIYHKQLQAKVHNYILDSGWPLPQNLLFAYPYFMTIIGNRIIPLITSMILEIGITLRIGSLF